MMIFIYRFAEFLVGLFLVIQTIHIFSLLFFKNDKPKKELNDAELPDISVLVAARNEAKNITQCLHSIYEMNYPANKISILIGNDNSEDETQSLIEKFIADKPNFKLLNITNTIGKARGKANVLAQLAHFTKADLLLITDADIKVNKNWAREISSFFDAEKTGIVSGATIVNDDAGNMQQIDWMYYMGLLKSFTDIGLPCTAVGNNMAIRKAAYLEVGGYENLDFSVTEDYKLFKEVRKLGWKTKNILNTYILNYSAPVLGFANLMHQRKRWLIGARELPLHWWLIFFIFGMFTPAIAVIFFVNYKLALIIYFIKLIMQLITFFAVQNRLKIRKSIFSILVYEIFSVAISLSTMIFYFLPVKLRWKNRNYSI